MQSPEHLPRLVLHIGFPKTGTTSIQAALRDNATILSEFRIYFPHSLGRPNNRKFSMAFEEPSELFEDWIGLDVEEKKAKSASDLETFKREITGIGENPDTVVISSEQMSWRWSGQAIRDFAEFSRPLFSGVTVLVFLRSQVSAFPSRYWLDLKSTLLTQPFRVWVRSTALSLENFDYAKVLRRWEENLPDADIRVVPTADAAEFDSVKAFFSEGLGLEPPVLAKLSLAGQRKNTSAPASFAKVLRAYNVVLTGLFRVVPHFRGSARKLRRLLLPLRKVFFGRPFRLEKSDAQLVSRTFYQSNLEVSKRYRGGVFLFPADLTHLAGNE